MITNTRVTVQTCASLFEGKPLKQFVMRNINGVELRAIELGCVVTHLRVPDRTGQLADVVLGFDSLTDYVEKSPYFGAVVGRFANRIANGRFTLDDVTYNLPLNNHPSGRPCSLHGGNCGFDALPWRGRVVTGEHGEGVEFSLTSSDGAEGYPGTVNMTVTYWLTADNAWHIDYAATTDKATPINLTQHTFFNLAGEGNGDILAHELCVHSQYFTPVNEGLIPTGEIRHVRGTPLDFTEPHVIGARIEDQDEQLQKGCGYDHNFVLQHRDGELFHAASVHEPNSGRVLDVFTTEPGMQFYSGNFLDGSLTGKNGGLYARRTGFCLETQHYPDSPNQPTFPDSILRADGAFQSTTVYRFTTR